MEWADRLREDIEAAFEEARSRPGGAVGRGPQRYYVEIHPEQLRGFVELVDHPWVRSVATAVLGPDYRIVELGFDVPLEGAVNQPWHRDFPIPENARTEQPAHLPRVQRHRRRHGPRHGPLRDRAGYPVGRRTRF